MSVPIFYATGNRKKGLHLLVPSPAWPSPPGRSSVTAFLFSIKSNVVFGVLFAGVAGIMVFVSLDELLPAAEEYGEHHVAIYGLVAGMGLMALSLLLFL